MGQAISYIAVKGKERAEILAIIEMQPTPGLIEGWVETHREDTAIGDYNGFTLIIHGPWKIFDERNETKLAKLSMGAELFFGLIEEHVGYSSAGYFKNGQKIWSIVRDAEKSKDEEIVIFGPAPDCCATAIEKAKKLRNETPPLGQCDFEFDIPVDVFEELVGFRYDDELIATADQKFQFLEKKRRWFF